MFALVNRRWEPSLAGQSGLRVVAEYPEFLLVDAPALPPGVAADDVERLDDDSVLVHGERVRIPAGEFDVSDAAHVLLRFVGPLTPGWRAALEASGVGVRFWCPRFGACAALPQGMDAAGLQAALPFVAGAQPYLESHSTRGIEPQSERVRRVSGIPDDLYDLVCFSREDRARVEAEVRARGIEVIESASSKIRVRYVGDPSALRELVGVKVVDPARAPVPLAASLQVVLGAAAEGGAWRPDLTGRGQVVAVADSGLDRGVPDDTLHPDFRGRVRYLHSWPLDASWAAYVTQPGSDDGPADRNTGHGTHVAGLAVGSGAASGGAHRGVAPEAELVFQAIEQYTAVKPEYAARIPSGYYLSGRPLDLRALFREARDQGARIHVNAWGDPAQGAYTNDSYEADLFLHENPDAVVLFAAGNAGSDVDADRSGDPRTLYAPASAKNVLSIGATEGGAVGVGMRGQWGDFDPSSSRYRAAADRADAVSGDPDRLALLSSAGPTADGRIKPELCAPGTNLAAPRSQVCSGQGWGPASPQPYYMYYGGTSMAVGVAGGFVALLRQAWQEQHPASAPGGAALKALAILGARPVLRRGSDGPESRTVAGFGRLFLDGSVPRQPGLAVRLVDVPGDALATGAVREYPVRVDRPGPFRAVLTWYDAPGEALVNDLDLCLVDAAGARTWGNHAPGQPGAPDRVNNVEVVDVAQLPAGEYTLRVVGSNVPAGAQAYALAVSAPAAVGIQLPVDCLAGVGSSTRRRLAAGGVGTISRLRQMGDEELGRAAGIRGNSLATLRARLTLLERLTATPPTVVLPEPTTLRELLSPGTPVPPGVPPELWRRTAGELSPLVLVFDSAHLDRIRVADLFGAG